MTPQGAIFNPGEGWVDLPSLISVFAEEFRALGGEIVTDAGRATINVEEGRARGVTTSNGARWDADAVLLAAGGDVPAIVAHAGQHIGDGTPVALLVRTKPINHPLKAVLNTPRVAIRPTPNGAFALDPAWSEEEVGVKPDGSYEVKSSTLEGLLREASKVLDGNPKLEMEDYGVGLKPIPGDGEPVFGELQTIPGYFVAFSHSGATLGLIAGELLADEIATRKAPSAPGQFPAGAFFQIDRKPRCLGGVFPIRIDAPLYKRCWVALSKKRTFGDLTESFTNWFGVNSARSLITQASSRPSSSSATWVSDPVGSTTVTIAGTPSSVAKDMSSGRMPMMTSLSSDWSRGRQEFD